MMTDPEKQVALEQWMQTASPEGEFHFAPLSSSYHIAILNYLNTEQHTVLKMFKSAEEAQVKEVGIIMRGKAVSYICRP